MVSSRLAYSRMSPVGDASSQRQYRAQTTSLGSLQDERRDGDVFQCQTEVAGDGAFVWRSSAGLDAHDQLTKIGIDRRQVLEVAELPKVEELRCVVCRDLVELVKQDVRIEIGIRSPPR